jgi:thymidylate synthase (FAD)
MIDATYVDHMGTDLSVVNAARVSFAKESSWTVRGGEYSLSDKDINLINYLAQHKHTSPFGHCFASFHVKAPVFVARQLVKHKFLRWNEISRRYVDSEPEFYWPTAWRGRSLDKKQGSAGTVSIDEISIKNDFHLGIDVYNRLLDDGVCPEQARMVLPQSMMTEWYWSGSLDAFADMCRLRITPDTQYESKQVALGVDKEMLKLFPVSWEALEGCHA